MQTSTTHAHAIPRGVWVLGFVSMLMDISSEMVHCLLPLFMTTVLGASALTIGVIEGLAESTALIVKIFSGALSDYLGKRKSLALVGYALSAATKPIFAIASGVGIVFSARLVDRIGKGIRGAPRDALVAEMTPPHIRGAAFGLRQSLDTVGAFVGPLLAVGLMWLWADNFRAVFWVAVIPGVMAVLLLGFGIQEPARPVQEKKLNPITRDNLKKLSASYWWVVGVGALFTLARFSEAFLVLRAQQTGMAMAWIPLIMVAMNLIYAATAYPFGKVSDRMSPLKIMVASLFVLMTANLLMASSRHWSVLIPGVALWGIHMGMSQGLMAKLVADTAPTMMLGTAYGIFNLVCGLSMLMASVIAGLVWDLLGAEFTFYYGTLFCLLTLTAICFQFLAQEKSHKNYTKAS